MTTTVRDPEAIRLGATIRALRKAHGLTVVQLARAVGVSRPYMSNVELGEKKAPPALCIRVARTFGIPLAALTVEDYERIARPA